MTGFLIDLGMATILLMDAITEFFAFTLQIGIGLLMLLALILVPAVYRYNQLQVLLQRVMEARSNIKVSLHKKAQLVNRLVDTAEQIAGHERVVQLRISDDNRKGFQGAAHMYEESNQSLATIRAVAQQFPELKGHQGYLKLMQDIQDIEREIQRRRERFNSICRQYNGLRTSFPTSLLSTLLTLPRAPYLDFGEEESLDSIKEFETNHEELMEQLLTGLGEKTQKAAKRVSNTVKDASASATALGSDLARRYRSGRAETGTFFYMDDNDMPRGPLSYTALLDLHRQGMVSDATKVVQASSGENETWRPLKDVMKDHLPPAPSDAEDM